MTKGNQAVMRYAEAFGPPTTAIVKAQDLGVLPRPLPPFEKLDSSDRYFLEAFSRCWANSKFIDAGLAEIRTGQREELLGAKRRLQGWKAKASQEYEDYYRIEYSNYDYGEPLREVTARLKNTLFLIPEQFGELDAIRRAAKMKGMRLAARDKRDREEEEAA